MQLRNQSYLRVAKLALVQRILYKNPAGAMVGINAVADGTDTLWHGDSLVEADATIGYDTIKNEYRGTPSQKCPSRRGHSTGNPASSGNRPAANLPENECVLERYTLFIDNYLADAPRIQRRVYACGQVFKDIEEEKAKEIQTCRIACITQSGKDAVKACEDRRRTIKIVS